MPISTLITTDRWLTILGSMALGVQLVRITGGSVPQPLLMLAWPVLMVMAGFKLWASRTPRGVGYREVMRRW